VLVAACGAALPGGRAERFRVGARPPASPVRTRRSSANTQKRSGAANNGTPAASDATRARTLVDDVPT
jgi:hypothetical protein